MGTEFFIVAAKRGDGQIPKLAKAVEDKIFFAREDAEQGARNADGQYGTPGVYEVYRFFAIAQDPQ